MKPEGNARRLLAYASAQSKMWEYGVPPEWHIAIPEQPSKCLDLAIAALGDFAALANGEPTSNEHFVREAEEAIRFASRFFDTIVASRLDQSLDSYDRLCASASYYLCDMPGSADVMARTLDPLTLDLGAAGTERVLAVTLVPERLDAVGEVSQPYTAEAQRLFTALQAFWSAGTDSDEVLKAADSLRRRAYGVGTPRELLFADASAAVVRKRLERSVWRCLPEYTGQPIERWRDTAGRRSFMREFWPAQRRLGEAGVLRGGSAVVQMPTGAGKTKAAELVLRSAFLSARTSLAVIVAPFRALCHEISADLRRAFANDEIQVDELSDVLQRDLNADVLVGGSPHVLVLTPEKLHYVLRHSPDLAQHVGLVIYDEGHLFDDTSRGVNYELLLASIKGAIPPTAQVLLISAVMVNADGIGEWLIGDGGGQVSNVGLLPTDRSVAFASWPGTLFGRLEFVDPTQTAQFPFFVPRVIGQTSLALRPGERSERVFPEVDNPNDIALHLGLRAVASGSVAVFCGRKDAAASICDRAADVYARGLEHAFPAAFSVEREVQTLTELHARNLGRDAAVTQCAALGIFAHHGNVPHGVRLAIEYAMQNGDIRFVVCTSTLAQGVNMPIRYLVVAGVYQGSDQIRVRDFQNLVGRAGRAGMHTEGTLVFADTRVYDLRTTMRQSWRWRAALELLDPTRAEPCDSAILQLLRPLHDDAETSVLNVPALYWIEQYLHRPNDFPNLARTLAKEHEGFSEAALDAQLTSRAVGIDGIESYLLAHSDEWISADGGAETDGIATRTLAFALADEAAKENVLALFRVVGAHLQQRVPDQRRRTAYGRTLLGVEACASLESWTTEHWTELLTCTDAASLLTVVWPALASQVKSRGFRDCMPQEALSDLAAAWMRGTSFDSIFESMRNVRIGRGSRPRRCTLNRVVDLCENAVGYEGSVLVGAIAEMVEFFDNEAASLLALLATLQKRLKYGLPGDCEVILYELGFADRPLALELARALGGTEPTREALVQAMSARRPEVAALLAAYPCFFRTKLAELIH